jgi:hypothetical protein
VLDWVLRIVDSGPPLFFRAALVSLAATSFLGIAIAIVIRPNGALPASQRDIIFGALVALVAVGVLVVAALIRPVRTLATDLLDRVVAGPVRAAIWLALALWFPTLLIIAYYWAKATLAPTAVWLTFGYLDKRWETSAFLLGALAPMLLLVSAARVLKIGREHPRSWWSWLAGIVTPSNAPPGTTPAAAEARRARPGRFGLVTAGIFTAVGLAYYFYGPPWYLDRGGPIGYQEDVFLQGLQAISQGHVPYIGPAAIQYGPGSQFLSYFFMRHVATFSVVGFRESWAMFQWVGASVIFVALFLAFGYGRALVASLMWGLIYPAQVLIGFAPGSFYDGFWGWANPLRYAGAVSLVVLLPGVIKRSPSLCGFAGGTALGVLWGGLSYIAQENLIGGAVGALVVSALLVLTGTASGQAAAQALLGVVTGSALVWVPVLVFYAVKGALGRFLYLYFLVPQAVAGGYSNTRFGGSNHSSPTWHEAELWLRIFEWLPLILAVLALVSVLQFWPFRVAGEWSGERIMLVAVLLTTILLYQGALLRSDREHLTGTMLIFPALVIVVATTLPRLTLPRLAGCRQPLAVAVAGAVLFAAGIWLLPAKVTSPSHIRVELESPYLDRQHLATYLVPGTPATIAGQRVGAGLANANICCQYGHESMPQFVRLMNHLHAIIGDRTTYVVSFHNGYPGLIYFVADLKPAPIPADPYTLVFTQQQMGAYLRTFRASVLPQTGALVTTNLTRPEAVYFRQRYPRARRMTLPYQGAPYYVLLSGYRLPPEPGGPQASVNRRCGPQMAIRNPAAAHRARGRFAASSERAGSPHVRRCRRQQRLHAGRPR